jgi:hypothetical protein
LDTVVPGPRNPGLAVPGLTPLVLPSISKRPRLACIHHRDLKDNGIEPKATQRKRRFTGNRPEVKAAAAIARFRQWEQVAWNLPCGIDKDIKR